MIATLLVICSLHLQAEDTLKRGGNLMVELNVESASVKEVLEALEAQTSFRFFYNHKTMSKCEKITLSFSNISFENALRELADHADLVFKVRGDQVVVKKKLATPVLSIFNREHHPMSRQDADRVLASLKELTVVNEVAVSGQVVDESNSPMPGVNIVVKGTSLGVTTDGEGRYSLSVPEDAVLVFSFVGYQTREVSVGNQTVINVSMQPDVNTLNEVVVIGYGTQRRSSVTGAVSSVQSEQIAALAVPSVESALQGRVAGVNITNNGAPGAAPIVRIRGIGSITGSSDPLYVVDGFPTGGLNNFDPKDIESVEVLKDAAAAAIYGSRAANGVILITTKKGAKSDKMVVDVDSYYGVQSAWKTLDLLNTEQYLQYANELMTNAGNPLPPRIQNGLDEPIYAGASQTYRQTNTDWQDEVFRSARISNVQASIAGGSEKMKVYASAGYYDQEGIMIGTNFKRYNLRFNSELTVSKNVTFGQTLSIASTETRNLQEGGGRTILQHVVHSVPYMPVYDPTKIPGGFRSPDNNDGSDPENPVRIQLMDYDGTKGAKIFGTAYLNVKILPFLHYKFTLGGDFAYARTVIDRPIFNDGFHLRTNHELQDNRWTNFSPLYQNQLTFDKDFGKHYINATLVAERQDSRFTNLNTSGNQASNSISSLQGGTSQSIPGNVTNETTLLSFLGRVNYEFGGKYLVSASLRRDGFSAFAPGRKWGNFPGVSVGWRLNEESFMSTIPNISNLKLRASYGSLGVNNVGGPFEWQSTIATNTTYVFGANNRVQGSYFSSLPNSELSWEITKMTNFGIDLGLFEEKFTLTAEYFIRKVDDLLLRVPIAPSLGYSVDLLANVGSMENRGFELQLGYNKRAGDLTFSLTGNFGAVRNKVLDMFVPGNAITRGSHPDFGASDITKTVADKPVQGFYGFVVDGIFQNDGEISAANAKDGDAATTYQANAAPGDIRFKDLDDNGVINDEDRTFIGSFLPDFTYGLNLSANYKNLDLTLFVQGVQGNEVYNGTKVLTQGMIRLFGAETEVLNAWTPDNTNTDIPRAVNADPNGNARVSDRFVEDGSYMRIKNLSIGYSVPAPALGSFVNGSVRKLRIYASLQNLLTITKYSGYDPEVGSRTVNNLTQGIDYGQFPQPRTIMAGIQLGL